MHEKIYKLYNGNIFSRKQRINLIYTAENVHPCTGMEKNMIDIKFLRENPDIVKQNIRNKFQDKKLPLVDEVIELDVKARAAKVEGDALRAEKNKIAKQIGALMAQGKKEEAEEVKKQVTEKAQGLMHWKRKRQSLTKR